MLAAVGAHAADPAIAAPHFLGSQTCQSSSCHGGGVDKQQTILWKKKDTHNRAHTVLSDLRSQNIAAAMGIADATKAARCTICHSPGEALPPERLAPGAKLDRGVSCETCHGPAEKWVRLHTRRDVAHDQNISAGLRETRDLYHRANVCIACHLLLDPGLVAAAHPPLFFEFDGQMENQPPHWQDEGTWLGPRAWLTGQAAALREISWRLTQAGDPDLIARWKALVWLLRKTEAGASLPDTDNFAAMQAAADRLSRTASREQWSKESALALLARYTGLYEDFRDAKTEPADLRRRGEVLLLGLDRLWTALKRNAKMSSDNFDIALKVLNGESQAQAGFDPVKYAAALQSAAVEVERFPKK